MDNVRLGTFPPNESGKSAKEKNSFSFYEEKEYLPMCWECFNSLLATGSFCGKHKKTI